MFVYCTEARHPGAPPFDSNPVSMARIFEVPDDDEGCPTCLACGKQVNAISCPVDGEGNPQPPQSILDLAARMANR